ncbi:MAG TPA: fibrobacter succinogenes major paralogous domain-containing protein, partial [Marinilabiliaceae bacterium]|nr:fibrobacter succinogenes major paralogous domain-containing protein [Marinilabiliaceae bacterium]
VLSSTKTKNDYVTITDHSFGSFTDSRDGIEYQTITIGNQEWMAENLKYLPSVVGPATVSETTAYYYVYGYDGTDVTAAKATANYTTYGVLYNWPAAMNACPTGWHLPSDAEWTELTDYLGGSGVAGGKLKEIGTTHWNTPNTDATNETGFTALPGGYRRDVGYFSIIGYLGFWWSATEFSTYSAWTRFMYYDLSSVIRSNDFKELGFSVRCLRD